MLFQKVHKPYMLEAALVIVVAAAGGTFAWRTFDALGDDTLEWRFNVVLNAFPSLVMFAAGRGMENIDVGMIPELADFYRGAASSFDPALIPKDYQGSPLSGSYAYMHFYLLYAIGWAWRLFGISFYSIHLLCTFLYMVMIAALYGVFRLAMGRVLSVAGVLLAAASPAFLMACPSLRDFGKAPFMFACFLLLGIFLKYRHSRISLLVFALVFGVVAGIGYGFRQDLLICIPAGIVVVAFFTQVDNRRTYLTKAAAILVLLASFVIAGAPVLYGIRLDKGSASAQAFTQGVSEIIENRMDFGYASFDLHHLYSDTFDFAVVNSYARRQGYTEPMPAHFSAGHGEAGGMFMREVMRQFPADMFARGLAALAAIPKINALASKEAVNITQPHGEFLRRRASLYQPVSSHFGRWGFAYCLAALAVLIIRDIRLGLAMVFLGLYFGAYPSLLYEFRHVFHLAFIPYLALGYLVSKGIRCAAWIAKTMAAKKYEELWALFQPKRMLIGVSALLAIVIALGLTLVILRIVQQRRVDTLLVQYENAVLEPVETLWKRQSEGMLLQPAGCLPGLDAGKLPPFECAGEYLALAVDYTGNPLSLRMIYADLPLTDFTNMPSHGTVPRPGLKGKKGGYLFFFPVYELAWPSANGVVRGKFEGLLIPESLQSTVKGLYRVKNSNDFALWPLLALPEHKSAFLTSKTGPVERLCAAGWIELYSFFGWREQAALEGYLQLVRHYPGYTPFEHRVIEHIRKCKIPERAAEFYARLLEDFPFLYPQVASDIERLVKSSDIDGRVITRLLLKDSSLLTKRGLQLEAEGNHEAAGVLYKNAITEMPSLMFAAENVDRFLLQHRDAETRLQEWAVLHGNYPDSGVICLFYGMALRGAGRMDEALASFGELAVSHVGFKDDAQLQIAVTEVMRNRDSTGVNKIAAWATLHPQRKSEVASLCSEAGRYFMGLKEYENAVLLFGMACELSPDDMWPCVAKGEALAAAGKHEQAIQVYKDVLSKAPESPYTAFNLDVLFTETNERITFWQELHEMHPEAAIPLLYLGKAQEAAGEHKDALAAYQKALKIDPSLDDVRNGITRLEAAAAAEGE